MREAVCIFQLKMPKAVLGKGMEHSQSECDSFCAMHKTFSEKGTLQIFPFITTKLRQLRVE